MRYWLLLIFLMINFVANAAKLSENKEENNFEVRVAVVDVQSVLEGSLAIQDLRKKIEVLNQKIQQDIAKKQEEFDQLDKKLIEQRQHLNESDFEKQVNEFNTKVSETKKAIQERKRRLEQAHAKVMGKIQEMTIAIISDLAEKYHLNLVIPSSQALYAKNNLNITSEVIFILNKKLRNVIVDYQE